MLLARNVADNQRRVGEILVCLLLARNVADDQRRVGEILVCLSFKQNFISWEYCLRVKWITQCTGLVKPVKLKPCNNEYQTRSHQVQDFWQTRDTKFLVTECLKLGTEWDFTAGLLTVNSVLSSKFYSLFLWMDKFGLGQVRAGPSSYQVTSLTHLIVKKWLVLGL